MLVVLLYLLLGVVVSYGVILAHIIMSEMKGYKSIEWWAKHNSDTRKDISWKEVIFGLIIWPVRIIQFLLSIQKLYEVYSQK